MENKMVELLANSLGLDPDVLHEPKQEPPKDAEFVCELNQAQKQILSMTHELKNQHRQALVAYYARPEDTHINHLLFAKRALHLLLKAEVTRINRLQDNEAIIFCQGWRAYKVRVAPYG